MSRRFYDPADWMKRSTWRWGCLRDGKGPHRPRGIFCGISSGASDVGDVTEGNGIGPRLLVTLFPDGGEKYVSTPLYEPSKCFECLQKHRIPLAWQRSISQPWSAWWKNEGWCPSYPLSFGRRPSRGLKRTWHSNYHSLYYSQNFRRFGVKTVTALDLRKKLGSVLNDVSKKGEQVMISRANNLLPYWSHSVSMKRRCWTKTGKEGLREYRLRWISGKRGI